MKKQPRKRERTKKGRIFVKLLSGKVIAIDISASDTVATLKTRIEEAEHIPVRSQRLVFGGNNLEDHNTLSAYDIMKEATIYLIMAVTSEDSSVQPSPLLQLAVLTHNNETLHLSLSPTDKVARLHELIVEKYEPGPWVISAGKDRLDLNKTFAEQGVTSSIPLKISRVTDGGLGFC